MITWLGHKQIKSETYFGIFKKGTMIDFGVLNSILMQMPMATSLMVLGGTVVFYRTYELMNEWMNV